MDNGFICICCLRRFSKKSVMLYEKYLCICNECNDKIKYVKPGTVFQGKGNIDSLLAPLFYNQPIKGAIARYKFASQVRYANIFSEILYNYLKDWNLRNKFDFLTAVPLSRKRVYERGYCQTELLANPLAKKLGITYVENAVYKRRHNPKQSRLHKKTLRFENVRDSYLADTEMVAGKHILLLDDIYTSGATMSSCAGELKGRGAKSVVGIALATTIWEDV